MTRMRLNFRKIINLQFSFRNTIAKINQQVLESIHKLSAAGCLRNCPKEIQTKRIVEESAYRIRQQSAAWKREIHPSIRPPVHPSVHPTVRRLIHSNMPHPFVHASNYSVLSVHVFPPTAGRETTASKTGMISALTDLAFQCSRQAWS